MIAASTRQNGPKTTHLFANKQATSGAFNKEKHHHPTAFRNKPHQQHPSDHPTKNPLQQFVNHLGQPMENENLFTSQAAMLKDHP